MKPKTSSPQKNKMPATATLEAGSKVREKRDTIRHKLERRLSSLRIDNEKCDSDPTFANAEAICELTCIITGNALSTDFFGIDVDFPAIIGLFSDGLSAVKKAAERESNSRKKGLLNYYAENIDNRIRVMKAMGSNGWEAARKILDSF